MARLNSYEQYCKAFKSKDSQSQERASLIQYVRNWFISEICYAQGFKEYISLDELLYGESDNEEYKDGLTQIVKEMYPSFKYISHNLREKIIRENTLVPIHKVREINGYGINWLSRRNGRTIKEKLSGCSSMMAVQRRTSFDTGENRLLLAFVERLADTIQIKRNYLPEKFVSKMERDVQEELIQFLRREDIKEIRNWENLPPNNTLLTNRYYSVIWRCWNDLQKLDELIKSDDENIDELLLSFFAWKILKEAKETCIFAQQPIIVDFDDCKFDCLYECINGIDMKNNEISISWNNKDVSGKSFIEIYYLNRKFQIYINNLKLTVYNNNKVDKVFLVQLSRLTKIVKGVCNGIFINKNTKIFECNKLEPLIGTHAVIDIFATTPNLGLDEELVQKLPFRVMRQVFINKNGDDIQLFDIGASQSSAIYTNLEGTRECYTVSSVLRNPKDIRIPQLISIINDYIKTNKLTFLVPDTYNDFQLSKLRKAVRVYYKNVEAIPTSIAALFSYTNTEAFYDNFKVGDSVIVANLVNDRCTLTLVESCYDNDILDCLQESKGIVWERHPSTDFFIKQRCDTYVVNDEQPYECCNVRPITDESTNLAIYDGDNWFNVDGSTTECEKSRKYLIDNIVDEFINNRKNIIQNNDIHILVLDDSLQYDGMYPSTYLTVPDCIDGTRYLDAIRELVNKPLWRDHLPNLAIKQLLGTFDLVKDQTIEPKVNNIVEININRHFTLPARKPGESADYHFQLQMNDGDEQIQYEAVVRHPAFPLRYDVECVLHMQYIYGADDAYKLTFKPIDSASAGFSEAMVNFAPIEEYKYNGLLSPNFPSACSWEELTKQPHLTKSDKTINFLVLVEKYWDFIKNSVVKTVDFSKLYCEMKKAGPGYKNLVAYGRLDNELVLINISEDIWNKSGDSVNSDGKAKCSLYCSSKVRERFYCDDLVWRMGKNNVWYAFTEFEINGEKEFVYFYNNQFLNPNEFSRYCTSVTFSVSYNKKYCNYNANNIVPGKQELKIYEAVAIGGVKEYDEIFYEFNVNNRIKSKTLFALHKIFDAGRNIETIECPMKFRLLIKNLVKELLNIYPYLIGIPATMTVVKMLSLITSPHIPDFYPLAKNLILNYDSRHKIPDEIGYVLGDCSYAEQIEILNMILSIPKRRKVLCILSKAIWKHPDLIYGININVLLNLFDEAIKIILEKVVKREDLLMLLEFILAIFRLRELNNDEINYKLSLNNPLVSELYRFIETLAESNAELPKSRLVLNVQRNEAYKTHNISDFLYACIIYIIGDSGNSEIKIMGISDSNEND